MKDSPYHKDAVAQRLRDSGWVSEDGRVRRIELMENFSCFFAGAFADVRLSLLTSEPQYLEPAIRSIFGQTQTVHPVWCILFRWFAESCVSVPGRHRHAIVLAAATFDKRDVERRLERAGSVTGAAKGMGIDAMRLSLICRQMGIRVKGTSSRYNADFLAQIEAAIDRGDSRQDIAVKFGLSDTTTSRLMSLHPRTVQVRMNERVRLAMEKRTWLAAVKANPTSTSAALRHKHRSTWSYLKRHDPEWLRTHGGTGEMTPHGRRVACPPELRSRLEVAIARAADSSKARLDEMPACRIAACTGVSEYAIKTVFPNGRPYGERGAV